MTSEFTEKLGLKGPIIVAPMGGGPTTPELVAACSNAGALGTLAGAYLNPEELRSAVAKITALTGRPFALNLFAPIPTPGITETQFQSAVQETRTYRQELGLPDPVLKPPYHHDFERQFAVVLDAKPSMFSFIFGLLGRSMLQECRARGILTMGTATSLDEALALEESGVDAVVAQGMEAGAHRGMFEPEDPDPLIPTLALTRLLVGRLRIPVVAAGGIMNGQGIADALKAGAQAAMLGTAFLVCDEAGTSEPYREAVLRPGRKATRLTRAFSGRLARGLENRFMREMETKAAAILPFPAQNAFTRDIRNRATQTGNAEFLSLWAGSGVERIRPMPASKLVEILFQELREATRSDNAS